MQPKVFLQAAKHVVPLVLPDHAFAAAGDGPFGFGVQLFVEVQHCVRWFQDVV